ncbi:MAG: hypothetical protein R3F61_30020 [Myxococcota bacterium]
MLVWMLSACDLGNVTPSTEVDAITARLLEDRYGEPFTVLGSAHSDGLKIVVPTDRHAFRAHPSRDPSLVFQGFVAIDPDRLLEEHYRCLLAKPRSEALLAAFEPAAGERAVLKSACWDSEDPGADDGALEVITWSAEVLGSGPPGSDPPATVGLLTDLAEREGVGTVEGRWGTVPEALAPSLLAFGDTGAKSALGFAHIRGSIGPSVPDPAASEPAVGPLEAALREVAPPGSRIAVFQEGPRIEVRVTLFDPADVPRIDAMQPVLGSLEAGTRWRIDANVYSPGPGGVWARPESLQSSWAWDSSRAWRAAQVESPHVTPD